MAARQMLKTMLASARKEHVARSHLYITPPAKGDGASFRRNKFWKEIMQSDVLVFDFQDGCPPAERENVVSACNV